MRFICKISIEKKFINVAKINNIKQSFIRKTI